MSPLAGMMALAFLLLIVLALLAWALLQPRSASRAKDELEAGRATPSDARSPKERPAARPEARPSNDDLRGARASAKRPALPDDAFERFLSADRNDDRA